MAEIWTSQPGAVTVVNGCKKIDPDLGAAV